VPLLEKDSVMQHGGYFEVITWEDTTGPELALKNVLPKSGNVAVDNQLWSQFLLDMQQLASSVTWCKANMLVSPLRMRKSAEEIAIMKKAAAIADETLEELIRGTFRGQTERQIASRIKNLLLDKGQEMVQFCIVGSGPNSAKPHHDVSDRVIEKGDVIVLDFGGTYQGYQSDMTRMVVVGEEAGDKDFSAVYDVVNNARSAAHKAAKPGVSAESVDRAAREVIDQAGYGEYFVHRTGHGIGIDVHEDPYIVAGNKALLEEGMAFSIEPGIYLPGRFGVRIEDIAIVTPTGDENINLSHHDIRYVK
jgi:Xaa-Pro aminopeptidase